MAHKEEYTTVIKLNSDEAKKKIDELQKKVDNLRKQQEGFTKDSVKYKRVQKEIDKLKKEMELTESATKRVNDALRNMSSAKPKELRETIKQINALLNSEQVERGSQQWKDLTAALKHANTELAKIKGETKAAESGWSRFMGFLNKNWGAFTQIVGAITGITMTIRKSVQDYAQMEEEMADVRKYTGLTADKVRELNEELKKMDTRTSREQLNQLAGSAGRLGLQSKKDIMEFVEAADMIGVALGDDLGDGAVDKIGKLAMAFGEDEKKGLKGAMLSTGSALNELAQNSSAQAGYLVDFTARVAGFGKQLGLTQAQIMGFGTVMDENMLRDEMAATAFGNMLTKMQTDTAKFARIASMDVKKFTDLLNKDANAAILALADNLKKADPQTMMKMLDDMGLDGSRAVGVLATLADKIDDVRKHQERATLAYEKATSVQGEFDTMNDTVQAHLDKCRKKFKEMAIELGERLLPMVQYTITGIGLLTKALSLLTGFVANNWKALVVLSSAVAVNTAIYKAHAIQMAVTTALEKAHNALIIAKTVLVNTLKNALLAWRIAVAALSGNYVRLNWLMATSNKLMMTNVWGALATVILTVSVAIWGAVKAWNAHSKAVHENLQAVKEIRAQQKMQMELNEKVAESTAEQKTKVEQLNRVIHSNVYSVNERRNAIAALQRIVPDYHASISNEGKLYNENTAAIKTYIENLNNAAMAEAIYAKKVEINKKKMELGFRQNRIEGSLKAVQAYREANPEAMANVTGWQSDGYGGVYTYEKESDAMRKSRLQQKIHEQRLEDVKSETKVVEAEDKYLDTMLKKNEKLNKLYSGKVTSTSPKGTTNVPTTTTPYVSDSDLKKQEAARKKAEAERKKQEAEERRELREKSRQLKAEMDDRLAEEAVSYSLGLTNYRDYIKKRLDIQIEGIKKRKALFEEGSAEYLKLDAEEKMLLVRGDEESRKLTLKEKEREHKQKMAMLEASFHDENSKVYHNEVALNEALFQEEMDFLQWKKDQAIKGSLEEMQLEWELEDKNREHQEQTLRNLEDRLLKIKTEYLYQSNDVQRDIELNALQELYDKKLLAEEDYQQARLAIEAKYAQNPAQVNKDKFNSKVDDALSTAQQKAGDANQENPWLGDLKNYLNINQELKVAYEEGKISYAEYLAAKAKNLSEFIENVKAKYQVMFDQVTAVYNGINNYAKACSDYEVAVVTKNYDRQIEAAGNNENKRKKLEEKKQKEIAAIKTKANQRAMKVEIAQALASTAMAAINAYSSAAAIPIVGTVLAPIAAAAAVAAGMLQVATIKKQHQTEEAGYYEGGFTGGKRYRKEAGVVHEGEFVANHQAVQNPAILPFLNFIDQAQRNNTVGSLTAQDVSRSMGGGSSQIVAPIVNVETDNEELRDVVEAHREATELLLDRLNNPIYAQVVLTGPDGLNAQQERLNRMLKNK